MGILYVWETECDQMTTVVAALDFSHLLINVYSFGQ